jgi:hypothetical protein
MRHRSPLNASGAVATQLGHSLENRAPDSAAPESPSPATSLPHGEGRYGPMSAGVRVKAAERPCKASGCPEPRYIAPSGYVDTRCRAHEAERSRERWLAKRPTRIPYVRRVGSKADRPCLGPLGDGALCAKGGLGRGQYACDTTWNGAWQPYAQGVDLWITCPMNGGASGGPWLVELNTGQWVIGGVNNWCRDENKADDESAAAYCTPVSTNLRSLVFDSRFLEWRVCPHRQNRSKGVSPASSG